LRNIKNGNQKEAKIDDGMVKSKYPSKYDYLRMTVEYKRDGDEYRKDTTIQKGNLISNTRVLMDDDDRALKKEWN